MNERLKVIVFVLVLAFITSGVLLSVDALTADRIQANQDAKLKSAILDAHDIDYTFGNINEVFDSQIQVIESDGWTFYLNPNTNAVTFEVGGGGVWGPIEGILTLEEDFETILDLTIVQQEETPGLGGVIAERPYLETFVGKKMVPDFMIRNDSNSNQDNEIDAITGATNTSNKVEGFLNEDYSAAKTAWLSLNE
ncbi:MAG TPA: FMN-binding protein [Candidatus Izemoplasmatales bacterium]|nr:FMN-binding protein [Candidatus Izemoplasmatales bacterium]